MFEGIYIYDIQLLHKQQKFGILVLTDYKLVICEFRVIYFISIGRMAIPLSIEITNVIFWLL